MPATLLAALLTLAAAAAPSDPAQAPPPAPSAAPEPIVELPAGEAPAPAPASSALPPEAPAAPGALELGLSLGLWGPLDRSDPRTTLGTALAVTGGIAWPQVTLELSTGLYGPSVHGVPGSGSECTSCRPTPEMYMVPLTAAARGYFSPAGSLRGWVRGGIGLAWWRESGNRGGRTERFEPTGVLGCGVDLVVGASTVLRLGAGVHLAPLPEDNATWPSWDLTIGLAFGPRTRPTHAGPAAAPRPPPPQPPPAPPPPPRPAPPPRPEPPLPPALAAERARGLEAWTARPSVSLRAGAAWKADQPAEYGGFSPALDLEAGLAWRVSPRLAVEASAGRFALSAPGADTCAVCATRLEVVPLLAGARLLLPWRRAEWSVALAAGLTRVVERAGYPTGGADWGRAYQAGLACTWWLRAGVRAGAEVAWLRAEHHRLGPGDLTPSGPRGRLVLEWAPGRTWPADAPAGPAPAP